MNYAEYKKQKAASAEGASSGSGTGQTMSYAEYKQQSFQNKAKQFDADIQSYLTDYQTFATTAEADSKKAGYSTAQTDLDSRLQTASDLSSRGDSLSLFLESNKDMISEDAYTQALSAIKSSRQSIDSIMDNFGAMARYYSQWDTEDAYNSYVTQQKDQQDKLNFDVDAGTKEIAYLENLLEEYTVRTRTMQDEEGQRREEEIRSQYGTTKDLKNLISEKKEYLEEAKSLQQNEQKNQAYTALMDADDFAEKSQYVSTANGQEKFNAWTGAYSNNGFDDINYDYINRNEDARSRQTLSDIQSNASFLGVDQSYLAEMTDDEISIFNYLYATQGADAAYEYTSFLTSDLNARRRANDMEYWADYAKEHPIASSIFSVATSPLKGLSYIGQIADYASDGTIDQNAGYNKFSYINSSIRNQVSQQIEQSGKWGKVGSWAYQLGMSMGDFVTSTVASGGNSALSLAIMGTGAAADTTIAAKERGLSDDQAFWLGTAAGAAEVVTEKIGLDALFDTALLSKSAAAYVLKNALSEGAEEGLADVINLVADVLIAKDKSEWAQSVAAYQDQGMSEVAAFGKAFLDQMLAMGLDILGGAISGGVMGSAGSVSTAVSNQRIGQAVTATQGGVESLKNAAMNTASEVGGKEQAALEKLAGKVSTENQTGTGLGSVAAKIRNAVNAQRVGSLYSRTAANNVELNVADLTASLEQNGFDAKKAASIAEAVEATVEGRDLTDRQNTLLESVWENEGFQQTMNKLVAADDSPVNLREVRLSKSFQNWGTAENTQTQTFDEPQEERNPTFQEEVQRQFEEANGYTEAKTEQKAYDIDEVFGAVQSAYTSGEISEDRYNEILESMTYAQSDYAEGNITEAEYHGALEAAMRQAGRFDGGNSESAYSASATDPLVDVDRETWQQAQRLAQSLGRDIVFYNGMKGENGYYKDGTICVNILAQDPFAQVVSHELTHSLEGTKHYEKLQKFVFRQLTRANVDISQARRAKYEQYKSYGKELQSQSEIDAEIVAEYVQEHLLTDEQSIRELVEAETGVAQRIWNWVDNLLRRMTGSKESRERANLVRMERIYAKALRESRSGEVRPGTVSVRDQTDAGQQPGTNELRQIREQTEADYREGRISDEEYDAAMDEYDRVEEERLGSSLEKYSVGTVQKNTTGNGDVVYSQGQRTAQADVTSRYRTAVDQILNMQNTNKDHLIIGYTPDVYRSLGMPSLPFVIGTGHVYSAAKTEAEARQDGNFRKGTHYHGLGADTVKNIYESLQDPVMIIASKDVSKNATPLRSTHSIVAIVDAGNAQNSLLLPVEIAAERTVGGVRMDVNALSSIYERDVTPLVKEAIALENTGDIGIYYAKKEALTLPGAGVRFPIRLQQSIASNSIIHRFSEKVNMNIQDATQSQQFKRWFGDWQNHPKGASKIVNADGTPKVVYHGTNADFNVFQSSDGNYWFSESEDYAETMMTERNGNRIIPAYLNMRNPYIASLPADQFTNPVYEDPIIRKAKAGGYDGVIIENETDNELAYDKFYVVFNPAQIKSAVDNVGTFDGNNPDIRYSFSDTLTEEENRRPMEGSYTTDEVEMQARKKGYPVLHGEQIVPFRTWVQTKDRGNYGLVTGMAPENKLLVSFHNKHDGGTADNVEIKCLPKTQRAAGVGCSGQGLKSVAKTLPKWCSNPLLLVIKHKRLFAK